MPPNMDEFNHPYRLACSYPYAHLNTNPPFLIGCNSYWIDYGLFAYQRGFMYIGLTSSILYFPLWWLWRSPYSYLLMGALFLLAFSWLMVRALGLNRKYALVALSYFPIAYSFIHDTGPLRLSLLSYPLLVLMLFRLLDHRNMLHKVVYAVGCALLMVVCVEDKPFYVFLLPSVAIFAVACRAAAGSAGGLTADCGQTGSRSPSLRPSSPLVSAACCSSARPRDARTSSISRMRRSAHSGPSLRRLPFLLTPSRFPDTRTGCSRSLDPGSS